MGSINKKIKAFTIMESMVSMVIIMIVFGLSSIVMVNVFDSGFSKKKQNAFTRVKYIRNETIHNKKFINEEIEYEDMVIYKKVLDYKREDQIRLLLIEAVSNGKNLYVSKELILLN